MVNKQSADILVKNKHAAPLSFLTCITTSGLFIDVKKEWKRKRMGLQAYRELETSRRYCA